MSAERPVYNSPTDRLIVRRSGRTTSYHVYSSLFRVLTVRHYGGR